MFDGEGGHEEFTDEMLATLTFLCVKMCQTCCHSRLVLIPRCFYYLAKGFLPCVRKQSQSKTIHIRQLSSKQHNNKTTQQTQSQQFISRANTTANANATPFTATTIPTKLANNNNTRKHKRTQGKHNAQHTHELTNYLNWGLAGVDVLSVKVVMS